MTGQGYGMGIGGCDELCPGALGHSLGCIVSLSESIKDRSLLISSLVTELLIPCTYWGMGARKTCYSPVGSSGSIGSGLFGGGDGGGLSTTAGWSPRGGRLRVQVWTGTWTA